MFQFLSAQIEHDKTRFLKVVTCSLLVCLALGGCSLWNGYLDPDYESSRADRVCHPYGACSQGNWVAGEGTSIDPMVAKTECQEAVYQLDGNEWWEDSVTRGLEMKRCMEKKGFTLQQ